MLASLLSLAAVLTARGALASSVEGELAADVAAVASSSPPLFSGPDARERTARLLLVWASRESAGHAGALGDCAPGTRTVATCRSFGAMQIQRPWLSAMDLEPADVLENRRRALAAGLSVLRYLSERCGSVRAGLRAYAGGTCAGTVRARALVEARCAESGAC